MSDEQEQLAFKAFAIECGMDLEGFPEFCWHEDTRMAWAAWMARAKLGQDATQSG